MSAATSPAIRRDRKWWKERWVAGHYASIKSPDILKGYLSHKGYSYAEMARRTSRERLEESGKPVSRQMISYLANGVLKSCEPDLAACIERVLDVPDHAIFDVLSKSPGDGHNGNREATAA